MAALCEAGRTVLIETSGAHDISRIDPRVHRIMDLKTPGSGEVARNLWSNIAHLAKRDEVKFVIGSREDYEWSREQVRIHDLATRCGGVLFSPIFGRIEPRDIVAWILEDKLPVRFNSRCTNSSGIRRSRVCEECGLRIADCGIYLRRCFAIIPQSTFRIQ